jgi:tRNA G18 (ribose-2'-O)-methylase SpoU
MSRGFFGIGIYGAKKEHNIGTLFRSAHCFNANFIYTVGRRYQRQSSDTTCAYNHIPLYNYLTIKDLINNLPYGCSLVGIELHKSSVPLKRFCHPEKCCYLLGAEDYGLPDNILKMCSTIVQIPSTEYCLNVAVSGSIVIYDRVMKYHENNK